MAGQNPVTCMRIHKRMNPTTRQKNLQQPLKGCLANAQNMTMK